MKLSRYARHAGVRYETTGRWFKAGHLTGYQTTPGPLRVMADLQAPTEA
jgi:predicted site-specific integrase-resolvase